MRILQSDYVWGGQAIIRYLRTEVCTTWAGAAGTGMSPKSLNEGQAEASTFSLCNTVRGKTERGDF